MNARVMGLVLLLVLVLVGLWAWFGRGPSAPIAPSTRVDFVEARTELQHEPPMSEGAPLEPARTAVVEKPAPDAITSPAFALVKVLVVEKETHAPLPGIDVSSWWDDGSKGRKVEETGLAHGKPSQMLLTDAAGRVEIEAPPRTELHVSAYGRKKDIGSDNATVPPLEAGSEHEVVLAVPTKNDLPFWMKIIDESSSAPLVGARVVKVGRGESVSLTTDERGLAFFDGRTWTQAVLRIEADGRSRLYLGPERGHETVETALVVPLPAAAVLRVHVSDAAGAPVAGARVELTTPGYNLARRSGTWGMVDAGDGEWHTTTDATGTGTIAVLPPRVPLAAGISKPRKWQSAEHITLEPGETRDVEWKLTEGCDVHGILLDQNEAPVVQRQMWLRRAQRKSPTIFNSYSSDTTLSATTDEQGRFRFPGVSAGTWSIGPSAPEYGTRERADDVAALAQIIEVAEGQSDLDVTLHVDRGLFIRGRLLDPSGEPCKTGSIRAWEAARKLHATGGNLEKKDGTFTLGPLMSGRYQLVGNAGLSEDADSEPLEVDAGTDGVELRLRAGVGISGRIVGMNGEPLTAKLWLTQPVAEFGGRGITCKPDGTFSFKGLLPGMYNLAGSTTAGGVGILDRIELKSGEPRTDLVLRIGPGGHVHVRHAGPEEYANVRVLQRSVVIASDGVERNTTRTLAAPAGTVVVRVSFYDEDPRVIERTVEIEAGKSVDVVIEKGAR